MLLLLYWVLMRIVMELKGKNLLRTWLIVWVVFSLLCCPCFFLMVQNYESFALELVVRFFGWVLIVFLIIWIFVGVGYILGDKQCEKSKSYADAYSLWITCTVIYGFWSLVIIYGLKDLYKLCSMFEICLKYIRDNIW